MKDIDPSEDVLPLYEVEELERRGDLFAAAESWGEARRCFELALHKRKQGLGVMDGGTAAILDKLARVYMALNIPEQALSVYREAVRLLEINYHGEHASLAPVLEHKAECLIVQKKYDEAVPQLERALAIYENSMTREHVSTLQCKQKLAALYILAGRPAEAVDLLSRTLKYVESPLGPSGEFHYELALAYIAQNKRADALEHLQIALKDFGQRHSYSRFADCLGTYNKLLENNFEQSEVSAYQLDIYPVILFRS